MEYVYIAFAVLGIGGTFITSKIYQTKYMKGTKALLFFSFWLAIGGVLFAFFANGCKVRFAESTLWLSLIVSATIGFNNVAGVIAMKRCKMSLYTTFILAGGMVIPSLVGLLFWGETLSLWRTLGIVAILIALVIPTLEKTGEKTSLLGLVLCLATFISNGVNNVASKMHQTQTGALSTQDFLLWVGLWYVILSLIATLVYVLVKRTKKTQTQSRSTEKQPTHYKQTLLAIGLVLLTATISGGGQIFNLMAAKQVDASLMYPLITGGTMLLSAVCGAVFFREKITKFNAISLLIAAIGTILFAL